MTGPQPQMKATGLSLVLRLWNGEARQSPRNGSQVSHSLSSYLPCFCGSGSWVCACSQCANCSQCIKLNTSVAPRRNLMSQNVLEQAPLFHVAWRTLPSHQLCCEVNRLPGSDVSTFAFLCVAFSGLTWLLLVPIACSIHGVL